MENRLKLYIESQLVTKNGKFVHDDIAPCSFTIAEKVDIPTRYDWTFDSHLNEIEVVATLQSVNPNGDYLEAVYTFGCKLNDF